MIKADQANCSPITMQIDSKLFKDNNVRVAMKLALDREQLIKNVTLGFGTVGNDLFGKGLPSLQQRAAPAECTTPRRRRAC